MSSSKIAGGFSLVPLRSYSHLSLGWAVPGTDAGQGLGMKSRVLLPRIVVKNSKPELTHAGW